MSAKLHAPLTLAELAKLLGYDSDRASRLRLLRRIRAREQLLGEVILRKSPGRTSPLTTTLPILREACPDWFDSRVEMENLLREYVGEIEEQIDELRGRDDALAKKLVRLEQRIYQRPEANAN